MKKIICRAVLVGVLALCGTSASLACGQKYLVKNFAVNKAQCYAATKPGAILIFKTPNDVASEKTFSREFEHSLAEAGHKVTVVEGLEVLKSTVKDETFDVILSGYSTAGEVEAVLQEAGKKAKLVPVVDKTNKAELSTAKERFGIVIKNTDRTSTKVLMINEVLVKVAKSANGSS